jgi:SAM-dependent methyltransferase
MGLSKRLVYTLAPAAVVIGAVVVWYIRDESASDAPLLFGAIGLTSGMTVADVGAGNGQLSMIAAQVVGSGGHVFSTEIDPKRLARLRKQSTARANMSVIPAGVDSTNLPADCCDAIFVRSVYHHFANPASIDRSLYCALRPGGRLAIADFPPKRLLSLIAPVKGVPANRHGHGVPSEVVQAEVTAAGFEFEKRVPDWPQKSYCVVFRKPAT